MIPEPIGQEQAKRIVERQAWDIREHPHDVATSLSFIGPTSSGKTMMARWLASLAGIPILEVQPQAIRKASDLLEMIYQFVAETWGEIDFHGATQIDIAPRFLLFIDEFHQINSYIEQAMLKATEPNDRMLVDEKGRMLDTSQIVFAFATTDRGDLFDALDCRTVKVSLRLYSEAEIAQIVKLNYPQWSMKACALIARYNPCLPREALAFARDMKLESKMTGNRNAVEVAKIIAKDHRIDEYGMTEQRVEILKHLGQAPVSRNHLRHVAMVKDAELQKFILPPLLAVLPDREQPLITVSSKGYSITPAGLKELDDRKIPNQGMDAIPESVQKLFPLPESEEDDDLMYRRKLPSTNGKHVTD